MVEPIFYHPEETELGASKTRCLKNNTDVNIVSLKCINKNEQQHDNHTVFGDSIEPQYQIVDVQWKHISKEINLRPKVVDTLSYINGYSYPVDKTFNFSWNTEEEQRTTWSKQWGGEECHEYEAEFPISEISVKITHNHMRNASIISVPLSITKSLQVTVAPKKTAIAQLVLLVSETVEVPFIATIKCISTNSNFTVEGSWSGTLHKISSSNINMCETEIGIM